MAAAAADAATAAKGKHHAESDTKVAYCIFHLKTIAMT